ncbi:MAG: hypothetical protein ABSG65_28445 [Bryobacteraceae bacterium]
MAEDPHAFVEGIEQNAVRSTVHVNGLDGGQRLGIPHHHRFAAAETVVRFGVDCHAPRIGIGDLAHGGQRIQIEYRDARAGGCGARDVQAAPVDVRIDVIEITSAADFDCF